MQHLFHLLRRRWRSIAVAFTLLGIGVTVPTRTVAQNPARKNSNAKESGNAPSHAAELSAAAQKPPFAKLLVGAWRGGRDSEEKEIVFKQDGAYDDLGANIFCEEHEVFSGDRRYKEQMYVRGQGTWRVADDELVLSNNGRIPYWSSDQREPADLEKSTCRFQIVRLDDNFLRLRIVPVETTQRRTWFFRRAEEKSVDKEFAAVPPEYRRVLAAAELTPDEAASFTDWLKAQKFDSPAQLEVIDRLMQARRHKITLAQLFGMTAEEAAAFREVVGQANGDYQRLARLATNDELTSTERRAIDKATSVITDLSRLSQQLPMDMQSRIAVLGRGGMEVAQQIAQQPTYSGFATNPIDRGGGFAGGQAALDNANAGVAAALAAGRGGRAAITTARGRGGARGRGFTQLTPNAETLDETQREAVIKLNTYFADLGNWFWQTAFPTD
ncbi:MAG TPA: hypothetical protein VGJ15_11490 [Pirellulales bacterium]